MQKKELLSCFLPYTDHACAERMAESLVGRVSEPYCAPRPALAAALLEQFRWAEGGVRDALTAMMAHAMQPEVEVHPAFPQLVGQLSELELKLFSEIQKQPDFPVLDFFFCLMRKENLLTQLGKDDEVELSSIELVRRTTSFVPDDRYYLVQAGLENLLRLGLIEIVMQPKKCSLTKLTDERLEQIYMTFEPVITAEAEQILQKYPYMRKGEVRAQAGIIRTTTFGLMLGRAIAEEKGD